MTIAAATLSGRRVTSARVSIPAWGRWYADASLDGEVSLAGKVDLVVADLTLRGTVLAGGPAKGRSDYRICGGAGGWGKTLPRRSYASDSGVRLANVLGDAAELVGETLAPIARTLTVGPAWTRPEGPAARLLELLAAGAWYVDEAGVTRLGKRAASKLGAGVTHGPVDRARGTVTLAAESIKGILPGVVVDELEAVDVEHSISAKDGLRSKIWGARGGRSSRHLEALRAVLDQLDPDRTFRGVFEYRVVGGTDRLELQSIRRSSGMPDLQRVVVRPGVAGAKSTILPGARVLVAFVDADPARPVVVGFEDAEGEGFVPTLTSIDAATFVRLGAGARPAIGEGDLAGGIWPCVPTQLKVLL